MDDGAKKAVGGIAAVLAAGGMFMVRAIDGCGSVAARSARHADDIGHLGSHADDFGRAGRHADDFGGAGRYADDLGAYGAGQHADDLGGYGRYGDDLAAEGEGAGAFGGAGGRAGNRTGASFGGGQFADEALDTHRIGELGDEAALTGDGIEDAAEAVVEVTAEAARFAIESDDDEPSTWPVYGAPLEQLPPRVRVLALSDAPVASADATLGSLAELERAFSIEDDSALDLVIARADRDGVRGGAGDPARSVEAVLLRAAQLGRRAVLVVCETPARACLDRAGRAASAAAELGPRGIGDRLVAERDRVARDAALHRLQLGRHDRVQLVTSAARR